MSDATLTLEGETVLVSSADSSSGKAYHTAECESVARMSTKEMDVAVANWKGFHVCEACQAINNGERN